MGEIRLQPGWTKADAIAHAAGIYDSAQPIRFLCAQGDDDVFVRDGNAETTPAAWVVPAIWDGMPEDLFAATLIRRASVLTGRCPSCDAAVQLGEANIPHHYRCPAASPRFVPALRRWERKTPPLFRGRRMVEYQFAQESS